MILAKFFRSKLFGEQEEGEERPSQLASLIMEAEFECEGDQISKELIVSLINLYTDAIEYYEEVCAYRARMYKRRLQVFLSRNAVASVLQGRDSHLILKREVVERSRLQAAVNSREMANRLMEKCEKRVACSRRLVEQDLKDQQENLKARIQHRKSLSNRSHSTEQGDFENGDFEETEKASKEGKNRKMSASIILSDIKNRNIKKIFI